MRSKISIVLMVGFVVSLCALPTLAQEEEQKAQAFVVWDFVVKPSMFMQYEESIKKQIELYAKANFPYPWIAYSTNDYHYYYVVAVESFETVDSIYKAFGEAQKAIGEEKLQALDEMQEGTYDHLRMGMYYLRFDLSYIPEDPRLTEDEVNFVWWNFYYIKQGMGTQANDIAKEWQDLYKANNIPDGWSFYVGDFGSEEPVRVAVGGAKSAADYFQHQEKTIKLFGEKYGEMTKKTMDICRRFEQKLGMPRPDLSYTPKEK
jgi:hypothetical protein